MDHGLDLPWDLISKTSRSKRVHLISVQAAYLEYLNIITWLGRQRVISSANSSHSAVRTRSHWLFSGKAWPRSRSDPNDDIPLSWSTGHPSIYGSAPVRRSERKTGQLREAVQKHSGCDSFTLYWHHGFTPHAGNGITVAKTTHF